MHRAAGFIADCLPAAVQGVRSHHRAPAAAVGIVVGLVLLVGGIVTDLVEFDRCRIARKDYEIELARVQKTCALIKLVGVDTVEDAQKLRGKTMLLDREDIDPEVIFAAELIGVEVFEDGVKIGDITEVLDYPGNSVYVVKGEKSYMIPAVKAFILNTDVDGNRMDVKLLEGMELDAG